MSARWSGCFYFAVHCKTVIVVSAGAALAFAGLCCCWSADLLQALQVTAYRRSVALFGSKRKRRPSTCLWRCMLQTYTAEVQSGMNGTMILHTAAQLYGRFQL